MSEITIRLTETEVTQLLHLLEKNESSGEYWGNKQQYWKRHKRIAGKLESNGEGTE
jgi:hypothetical protein